MTEQSNHIATACRKAWRRYYRELFFYTLVVRYKWQLYAVSAAAFIMGVPSAFNVEFTPIGKYVFVALWGFLVAVAFVAGANHLYTGLKIKRIIRELRGQGIFVSKKEVLFYTRYLRKDKI